MMPDDARVSTDGQSVEAQVAARTAAGRERRRPTVHVCAGWHSVSGLPDGSEAPACASRRTPAEYSTKRLTISLNFIAICSSVKICEIGENLLSVADSR